MVSIFDVVVVLFYLDEVAVHDVRGGPERVLVVARRRRGRRHHRRRCRQRRHHRRHL